MKKIVFFILICVTINANTFYDREDLEKHFFAGVAISSSLSVYFQSKGDSLAESFFKSFLIATAIAYGKEYVWDKHISGGVVDSEDARATSLGGLGGSVVTIPFYFKF